MCASMVTLGNKNADPFQYTCVSLHSCQELNQPFPLTHTHTHTLPDFSDTHTHTCRTTLFQTQYKPILFRQQINSWLSRIMSCSHKQIKIAQTDDGWYFAAIFVAVFVPVLVEEHHFYLPSSKPGGVWSGKGQSSSKNPEVA